MIIAAEIPQIPGDMDALLGHARGLHSTGTGLADTGARVHRTWQGLAAHYTAPEAGALFAATAPVQAVSASVGEDVGAVGSALTTYAETVRPIQARLVALQVEAAQFVAELPADDSWRSDAALVERNKAMLDAVTVAVAAWMEAQRVCANAILALYTAHRYRADDADGVVQPAEFGFTADQLAGVLAAGQALPWGAADEQDHGFLGDVWSGVGGFFVDGLWADVVGVGGLVGLSADGFSWDTFGESWSGLGQLTIIPYVDDVWRGEKSPWEALTTVYGNWGKVGAGLIALDEWSHNPGGAVGQVLYNLVTLPIAFTKALKPVVAANRAGDAGHAAGAAADAGRLARLRASLVDGLNRMPTVDEIVRNIGDRLNIHPPRFGPVPAIVGDAGAGPTRFDVETPAPRAPDTAYTDTGRGLDGAPPAPPDTPHPPGDPAEVARDTERAAEAARDARARELGQDPATGQYRVGEGETALRVEDATGANLSRSPDPSVDWVDNATGDTYDAVGNFPAKHFDQQWPNLQTKIVDHLAKADYVPIDVSRFTPEQTAQVQKFITDNGLGPRAFLVGN